MNLVENRLTVADGFEKETSATPKYNVGCEIVVCEDGVSIPTTYKYIQATANLTKNVPYVLVEKADTIGTASAATSEVAKVIGIPQVDIAKDYYGFVAVKGLCKAATGIQAKGDTLEVINSGVTLIVDGSSGSPAETAGTVAISAQTAAAAGTVLVNLLGKRVTIAAS